jgi:hypothetical protein
MSAWFLNDYVVDLRIECASIALKKSKPKAQKCGGPFPARRFEF